MEQPRFFEVRGEQSGEWLVLDAKHYPPRVICRCMGWNAPKNAALIVAALEAHNSELYAKFALGSVQRLVANPCLASDKADLTPLPDPATGKPLNKSRMISSSDLPAARKSRRSSTRT
jgi:hypothetical protein